MRVRDNPVGSAFDDFLKEGGIYEKVTAHAVKRVLAWQIGEPMGQFPHCRICPRAIRQMGSEVIGNLPISVRSRCIGSNDCLVTLTVSRGNNR